DETVPLDTVAHSRTRVLLKILEHQRIAQGRLGWAGSFGLLLQFEPEDAAGNTLVDHDLGGLLVDPDVVLPQYEIPGGEGRRGQQHEGEPESQQQTEPLTSFGLGVGLCLQLLGLLRDRRWRWRRGE